MPLQVIKIQFKCTGKCVYNVTMILLSFFQLCSAITITILFPFLPAMVKVRSEMVIIKNTMYGLVTVLVGPY